MKLDTVIDHALVSGRCASIVKWAISNSLRADIILSDLA